MDDPYQSLTKEISEREFCGAIIKGDTKASDSGLKPNGSQSRSAAEFLRPRLRLKGKVVHAISRRLKA